jgi:hypothetical protein
MFYIKSKDKRKNVLSSVLLIAIFSLSTYMDNKLMPPQSNDLNIQQAGWFWGRHVKEGREVYRIFGIAVYRYESCPTYDF